MTVPNGPFPSPFPETVGSGSQDDWTERDVDAVSATAMLSGLEPFRNYSVRVAAQTGAGSGISSDAVYCSTPEAGQQK